MSIFSDFSSRDFKNWPESIDFRPRQTFLATSVADVVKAVKDAGAQARRLRAIGSAWSFSDVAVAQDYLLDIAFLNRVLTLSQGDRQWGYLDIDDQLKTVILPPISPVLPAALLPGVVKAKKMLVHVEAGITLLKLYNILDRTPDPGNPSARGRWALPTMGGSAGQTLAGAISTSTHGGDFRRGPVTDMVRAIDMILPDGSRLWLERADTPITSAAALTKAFAKDPVPPTPHYDTDEFLAMLVSFGSMGVIVSYVLEVVPQFGLSQLVGATNWNAVKPLIANRTIFNLQPPLPGIHGKTEHPTSQPDQDGIVKNTNPGAWALEIYVNPYRLSDNYLLDKNPDRDVVVVSRAASSVFVDPTTAEQQKPDTLVAFLEAITWFKGNNAAQPAPRNGISLIMRTLRTPTAGFRVGHFVTDTYDYSQTPQNRKTPPIISIEFVMPTLNGSEVKFIDALLEAFDGILQKNVDHKFAGAFSMRYSQQSQSLLAMQNFDKASLDKGLVCHVEILCLHNIDVVGNRIYGDEDEVGLKNGNVLESDSTEHYAAFEALAAKFGGRMHWGQMSFTDRHNPQGYKDFQKWMGIRNKYNAGGTIRVFDNDFTTRYGISAGVTTQNWRVAANALLPGQPTPATPTDAPKSALMPPTVIRTGQDCLELFALGNDGQMCWTRQAHTGEELLRWSWVQRPDARVDSDMTGSFVKLAPQFDGRIGVGINSDLHPELFARCVADAGIYHSWRNLQDNTWHDWTRLKDFTGFASSPDVAMDADQKLAVVARTALNALVLDCQNNNVGVVGWDDWSFLPDAPAGLQFTGDPCVVRDNTLGSGLLWVFSTTTSGVLLGVRQTGFKASSSWGNWEQLSPGAPSQIAGSPVAALHSDGSLEVFAVDSTGRMRRIRQNFANVVSGNWAGCVWQGMAALSPVTPGLSSLSRPSAIVVGAVVHVAAITTQGKAVYFRQNGTQYPQTDLGGNFTSQPSLVAGADGHLEIFVKFANDLVQRRSQVKQPNGSFDW